MNDQQNMPIELSPSWSLLVKSYRLSIKYYEQIGILLLLPVLFNILGTILVGKTNFNHLILGPRQITGFILIFIWLVATIVNYPAINLLKVRVAREKKDVSIKELYKDSWSIFIKVWLTTLVSYILIAIGLVLFIVPGVLIFRRYYLSPFYAVENSNLSVKKILTKSTKQTQDYAYYVYGTAGVVLLINLILVIIFGNVAIGGIFIAILSYSVLFLPVLRYKEITAVNSSKKTKKSPSIKK